MQANPIDKMAQLALQYPQLDISDIYNTLMQSIPDADVGFVSQNYAMFLTIAREARNAPQDIKKMILESC